MQQATLVSYFSKQEIVVAPTLGKPGLSTDVASAKATSPLKNAIIEASRTHFSSGSTQPDGNESGVQRQEGPSTTGPPVDIAPISHPSPARIISIPTLPEATISPVAEEHLPAVRRLTSTTLPVRYSDVFFTAAVTDPSVHRLSRVALYESEPVGWIRCRLEPCSSSVSAPLQIYVQALAVLSPYRNLGLATSLLTEVLAVAGAMKEPPICVYAHVWEKNEDALEWYDKRCFKRVTLLERYYLKLKPSGAWIVRRELDSG